MIVYRLSRTKWAKDLTGEGARLNGGRWNHKGTSCIYTSESRALAVLEYTVNINIHDIPRALSMVSLDIPDNFLEYPLSSLPGNWRASPAPTSTKDLGTDAIKANTHPVLRLPSSVLTEEFNYLINPLHPDSAGIRIVAVKDFVYDVRIKEV